MAPNVQARKNHDELFPNYESKMAVTDPEFIDVFDNFAFDEVLKSTSLNVRKRIMIQLASMIAVQAVREFRVMSGAALNVGVTPVELKEIVYQAVPYCGIAKVFDFLHTLNEVLVERGIGLPLEGQSTTTPENRRENGLSLMKQLVGIDAFEKMNASFPSDEKHFADYLAGNCFGDHVSRGGIDLPMRELLTFSMLVSLGGCDAQARGHVAINLNIGNSRSLLIDVVTQLLPYIGYPRALNALRAIDDVCAQSEHK